jgi:hypothetical protein
MQSMIAKSLPIPKARKTTAKGMSFVTVFILQLIRGAPLSFFTISLNTAGNAAIPFGTERIYVIQGVDSSLVLKVYTKLKAILYCPTTAFSEPLTIK